MRTPICDIQMFPASPKTTVLMTENANLKKSNNALVYTLFGLAVLGLVCAAIYLHNEELEKERIQVKQSN